MVRPFGRLSRSVCPDRIEGHVAPIDLRISFDTNAVEATFRACLDLGVIQRDPLGTVHSMPTECATDRVGCGASLTDALRDVGTCDVDVVFDGEDLDLPEPHDLWCGQLSATTTHVKLIHTELTIDVPGLLELLRAVPFTVATVAPLLDQWPHETGSPAVSLAAGHYPLGLGCAFKGEVGHARLASRRWLGRGPWRWLRDAESDLSFIQFHAIDAPSQQAVSQSRSGHLAMGLSESGGILPSSPSRKRFSPSLYEAATQTSVVLVPGSRTVSTIEMLEGAAHRGRSADPRIEQVAWVFTDEANARRHLDTLWALGMEVRAITDTGEIRLDLDHTPAPVVLPRFLAEAVQADGLRDARL